MDRLFTTAALLWLALLSAGVCAPVSGQDELAATSNGDHAWAITPREEPGARFDLLYLVSQGMELGFARLQGLSQPPEELIAWRDQFFAIFPPARSDDADERQVLSIQVMHNEPLDVYYAMPRGRFRLEQALPAKGEIVASTSTGAGPVVLLVEHARRASQSTQDAIELPALLQLRSDGWRSIELPANAYVDRSTRLVASGVDGTALVLLTRSMTSADRTTVFRRVGEGPWQSESIDLDLDRVERLTRLGDQAIVAIAGSDNSIDLATLRATRAMRIATIDRPASNWNIVGSASRLYVVRERADSTDLEARHVDVITGEAGNWTPVTLHETGQFKVWLTSLLIAAAMSAVLLFALLRPIRPAPVTRERNIRLAPLSLRAAALLIDLIPATIPTLIITRCRVEDLLSVPLLVTDFFDAGPFFVMTGFMLIHTTIGEVLTGRTLGKYVMGIRIVGQMVDDVRAYEAVLRNLGKGVSLAVPPLLLIVAMNPNLQGLGDIMGRTLVVRPRRADALGTDAGGAGDEDDSASGR